jgi:hypothetical protein
MDAAQTKCSRSGCSSAAIFKLNWRNPKIHTDGRTKVWLACEQHHPFLVDYLDSRGFYLGEEKIQ